MMSSSVGVFIDADNVSADMVDLAITKILSLHGKVRAVRAFGNWSAKPIKWRNVCNKYGISTTHRYTHTRSKNASDIALVVDATASIQLNSIDTLIIVSSDSDFLPLVEFARQCGKKAVGFGERKTPIVYVNQCDDFHFLEELPDIRH